LGTGSREQEQGIGNRSREQEQRIENLMRREVPGRGGGALFSRERERGKGLLCASSRE